MDNIIISLSSNHSSVADVEIIEHIGDIKRINKKTIWVKDLLGVLCSSLEVEQSLRLGKMPGGFYDGTISTSGDGFECLIVVPEGIKPFIYYDKVFNIPFPTLMFHIKCNKGVLKRTFVYALESDTVNDETLLYAYPFGNINSDNIVCWGSNAIMGLDSLRSAEKVISVFFGASTNDDLWSSKERLSDTSREKFCLQRGLVEYLVGKSKFPKEFLLDIKAKVGTLLDHA